MKDFLFLENLKKKKKKNFCFFSSWGVLFVRDSSFFFFLVKYRVLFLFVDWMSWKKKRGVCCALEIWSFFFYGDRNKHIDLPSFVGQGLFFYTSFSVIILAKKEKKKTKKKLIFVCLRMYMNYHFHYLLYNVACYSY